jgi:hypothetical protein
MSVTQPLLSTTDRLNGEALCFATNTFFRTLKSPLRSGLPNKHAHSISWSGLVRNLILVSIVHTHKAHRQVKNSRIEKNTLIDHIRPGFGRVWLS